MDKKRTLIVGADDSNHAGTSKGEIIVATFSFLLEDSVVKPFPNNRDYQRCLNWLKSKERDYLFSILASEKYRHSSSNLVSATPELVKAFMESRNIEDYDLKIYLDGILSKEGKNTLRNSLLGFRGIERIVIDNFIKKNINRDGFSKKPYCPAVVYHADILAHTLY